MTEDSSQKASDESSAAATAARQRKKRKWDQPAESLISAGVAVPGVSLGMGGVVGISLPGVVPLSGVPATFATVSQLIQSSSLPQSAAAIVQKLNQPKIQDELIAREIVINDAEPAIRYKLTKRQTQEEIQKCTGAVVITRGKYRPNGLPDSEKPLYLHISAGSHLKDTVERIKAVDRAASMVEEILKQGQNSQPASTPFLSALSNGEVAQPRSTCVYLGFDADPSLNIAARIRGPNDQYINHIMNETGATVVLRGWGSGNLDSSHAEGQLPLHLYLSSTNPKSLEDARILAENLLDTISAECGASRISSCKVYGAVPPPQQLMAGVQNSKVSDVNGNLVAGLPCTAAGSAAATESFPPTGVSVSTGSNVCPPGALLKSGALLSYGSPPSMVSYTQPSVTGGTCYSGYEGIYPQATPLQQVALALRQAPASTAVISSSASLTSTALKMNSSSNADADKRPPQKRKFQELPVTSKEPAVLHQNSQPGSEFLKSGSEDSGLGSGVSMPPPKLVEPRSNGMPPPPSRNMPCPPPKFSLPRSAAIESRDFDLKKSSAPPPPPRNMPPPPPKFSSQSPPKVESRNSVAKKSSLEPVSDILMKLAEYGDEDDNVDDTIELPKDNPTRTSTSKPFWAV
ncbi:protein RIK isoform X2 [Phoenix dactylifera]|uniref:Protein RIK n=1 Tax=Phoenix dactylifera TaxID=42345 RepID=A0A8B8J6M9_PHODC|nr:protein RIK isoform X2 [Phoenix dactylifera]